MKPNQKLKLRDIKKNQVFLEEDMGMVVRLQATEDSREVDVGSRQGWECSTKVVGGTAGMADDEGNLTLFECHEPGAYGLRLYSTQK